MTVNVIEQTVKKFVVELDQADLRDLSKEYWELQRLPYHAPAVFSLLESLLGHPDD